MNNKSCTVTKGRNISGHITHIYSRVDKVKDWEGNENTVISFHRRMLIPMNEAYELKVPHSSRVFKGFVVTYERLNFRLSTLLEILKQVKLGDIGSDFQIKDFDNK